MVRTRGVCFSNSARAIVLPEADMSYSSSHRSSPKQHGRNKKTVDMNAYVPDSSDMDAPPKGMMTTPAQRAVEEIRRHAGVISHFLQDLELQQADEERFTQLQEQYTELSNKTQEMGTWLDMIKTALQHYDDGELSARRFANEVDAAIKGWEGK